MATIYIGNAPHNMIGMPEPKYKGGLTVLLQDIDAATTTRSADGTMLRDRVSGAGDAKRKLQLEWPPLSMQDAKAILTAIKDEFVWVRYPDPYDGVERTAEFYAGDRTVPMYSMALPGRGLLWQSLKVDLIEK